MKDFAKKYFDLLNGEYKGINLTRINTFDEFYNKQIIDSIGPLEASKKFNQSLESTKILLDVGFGGGFPVLPIAFMKPDFLCMGVDTRGKKARVVSEIAAKLGLKNVKLFHSRIEHVLIDKRITCTFKAVGKVNDFLNKINTTEKIHVYFYKGPNFYTLESDQLEEAKKNWNVIEEIEIDVDGVDKRYLIGFENKIVPCGTSAKKSNNLVKLSDLI
jgi:16S rRNA (guanine527-N7)-methyltransferase